MGSSRHATPHLGRHHAHGQHSCTLDDAFGWARWRRWSCRSVAFQLAAVAKVQLKALALVCCAEHQQLVWRGPRPQTCSCLSLSNLQLQQMAVAVRVPLLTVEAEERHHQDPGGGIWDQV